jgi:hypothetical protein
MVISNVLDVYLEGSRFEFHMFIDFVSTSLRIAYIYPTCNFALSLYVVTSYQTSWERSAVLTAVLLNTWGFWDVSRCREMRGYRCFKGTVFLRSVGNDTPNVTESHPRRRGNKNRKKQKVKAWYDNYIF